MSKRPFNGNGIPSDLNETSSDLYNDEYFQSMEAVDNFNLFSEFTNIISVVGSKTDHL